MNNGLSFFDFDRINILLNRNFKIGIVFCYKT